MEKLHNIVCRRKGGTNHLWHHSHNINTPKAKCDRRLRCRVRKAGKDSVSVIRRVVPNKYRVYIYIYIYRERERERERERKREVHIDIDIDIDR